MGYTLMVTQAPWSARHVRRQVESLGKDDRHEWHKCRFTTGDLNIISGGQYNPRVCVFKNL